MGDIYLFIFLVLLDRIYFLCDIIITEGVVCVRQMGRNHLGKVESCILACFGLSGLCQEQWLSYWHVFW